MMLDNLWRPLMEVPTIKLDYCAICGRPRGVVPLEQHHLVKRSQGNLYKDGKKQVKPTITLCGFGNNLRDSSGHYYCHGRAHNGMLHFRWIESETGGGVLQYLETDRPMRYMEALESDGWKTWKPRRGI